jgi:hypothetical protein
MVPYIVELLNDDAALVRMAALRTLIQVVGVPNLTGLQSFIPE